MDKTDIKVQFRQTLRILKAIVEAIDERSWISAGCGYQTPVLIAYHALLGIGYYIGHVSELEKSIGKDVDKIPEHRLPSQNQILDSIGELDRQIDLWLDSIELDDKNIEFPWAGETNTGLMLFLLRHTIYHIGELNAIMYQLKNGDIEDLWMKGFDR